MLLRVRAPLVRILFSLNRQHDPRRHEPRPYPCEHVRPIVLGARGRLEDAQARIPQGFRRGHPREPQSFDRWRGRWSRGRARRRPRGRGIRFGHPRRLAHPSMSTSSIVVTLLTTTSVHVFSTRSKSRTFWRWHSLGTDGRNVRLRVLLEGVVRDATEHDDQARVAVLPRPVLVLGFPDDALQRTPSRRPGPRSRARPNPSTGSTA